jgi:TorA maturation chaperone TorD
VKQDWLYKAALYEILAKGYLVPTRGLVEILVRGEYAEALGEIAEKNGLDPSVSATAVKDLAIYGCEENTEELFHLMRAEYTALFVGSPKPIVSPYAGVWAAKGQGTEPLLFVNEEALAIERFMRSCGIGRPKGTNEPLDHIASLLEFLQCLCLVRAGVAILPTGAKMPKNAYETFYATHFSAFSKKLATATIEAARIPYYRAVSQILAAIS